MCQPDGWRQKTWACMVGSGRIWMVKSTALVEKPLSLGIGEMLQSHNRQDVMFSIEVQESINSMYAEPHAQ
jgi:hypothetical protein